MHNPLDQFKVKPLIEFNLLGYDLSLTNSSLFMVLVLIMTILFFIYPSIKAKLIPDRLQAAGELIYEFINDLLKENLGDNYKPYIPLIFTIFIFVLLCNLLGLAPYGFTVTSQIIVTFTLALIIFISITLIGFIKHGFRFLSLFLPAGTPGWLAPLMIIIELFTYLSRPISLSIRLTANMVAGHIFLKILGGFILILGIKLGWLPLAFTVVFTGFEFFVAILQAYIFSILTCVYLNDALNLHEH